MILLEVFDPTSCRSSHAPQEAPPNATTPRVIPMIVEITESFISRIPSALLFHQRDTPPRPSHRGSIARRLL